MSSIHFISQNGMPFWLKDQNPDPSFLSLAAMADTLFDFELLDSADDFMDLDLDPMEQEVAAAESAQLEADQDEMAIYVIPPDKTP